MNLERILCANAKDIKTHGRQSARKTPYIPLFWTASGIELNITGSELWLEYECRYGDEGEAYLRVEIDGADMLRFMLEEGINKVCIFRGYTTDGIKNVRILRENQGSTTVVNAVALHTDGTLLPLPPKKLHIEFIGDSVTSGEGLAGAKHHELWIPCIFSTREHYALLTAKALDADVSIVSQSGWGVYSSWYNNTFEAVPRIYEQVCGAALSEAQQEYGSLDTYDFAGASFDAVVVNLGTNDCTAFTIPEWVDENGTPHKQHLDDNGHPCREAADRVANAVISFCRRICALNPDALILWCYNMLSDLLNDVIKDAVLRYANENGDNKAFAVMLPHADPSTDGSRQHPGPLAHRMYADVIIKELSAHLK